MRASIAAILRADQVITALPATDRWRAIDALLDRLVETASMQPAHREAVARAVFKRERSMSTGIGFGIGIPHATTDAISEPVAALGRSQQGIAFDALDGQPVTLVLLFLVPQGRFQEHLHTVADIARLLKTQELRRALEHAADASTMLQIIRNQGVR